MNHLSEGQPIPSATFHVFERGALRSRSSDALFRGRRVVLFALPGAFTPTCSSAHLPRYEELEPEMRARGIDEVVCVSVNDAFVMDAWGRDQGAQRVTLLADGNGEFTRKMGMLVEKEALGFGQRSWRYSMLVEDGVISKLFVEPDVEGDPYERSDADTMLRHIDPSANPPPEILMFTKPGCSHCRRARTMLQEAGLDFSEVGATPRQLRALSKQATTPRVFIDGALIGGADELTDWLERRS